MSIEKIRPWLVRWMGAVVAAHLLVGLLLPWIAGLAMFDSYHRDIEQAFWGDVASMDVATYTIARAEQAWWISLFGPTVQCLSLWMGALTYIGDRQRSTFVWGWMIAGIVLWAPQDILISLKANAWIHIWVDCFAIATMLPPLVALYVNDRTPKTAASLK